MKPIAALLIAVLLYACQGNVKEKPRNDNEQPGNVNAVASLKEEPAMDKRAADIDTLINHEGSVLATLRYSKDDIGEAFQVYAYLLKDNTMVKLEEQFADNHGKNSGTRIYYLNNGKPFLTQEKVNNFNGSEFSYYDRISYYAPNGDVLRTKERSGPSEDEVANMPYKTVGLAKASIDRAMRALNQEGEFVTKFEGLAFQEAFTYIIVGDNKPDGYSATVRCDFQDQLLTTLSQDQKKYIGRKLRLNFQEYTDPQGYIQMIYTGGDFAK